jgi:hypothetical protein
VKSILDRSFHYTPSAQTDLKKTFARIRREQHGQTGGAETHPVTETRTKIVPIKQRKTNWALSRLAVRRP